MFFNRVYPPERGATGRVLRDLAHAFAKEGWHVTVITSGPQKGQERDGAVRIVRVKGPEKPGGAWGYFWVWLKMVVIAMRLKPRHLIITMTDPPLVVAGGAIVAKFKKSRHIHWCQDLYPEIMPVMGYKMPVFLFKQLKKIRRKAMDSCDKIIVPGRCMARVLSLEGLPAQKITMIPNWPELELVDPELLDFSNHHSFHTPQNSGARPHEEQIKDIQRFRVLYAGNLGLIHPIDTIIGAAEILYLKKSDVEFVFVGEGPRFDMIAAERAKRGLENIRILPRQPVSKLYDLLESGDLHLVTLNDDAAGLAVPSKLYAGLVVGRPVLFIGPEQSECAKVIKDFKAGRVLSSEDPNALAQAISDFRQNAQIWFDAHKGANEARENFLPFDSLHIWIERAWSVIEDDLAKK